MISMKCPLCNEVREGISLAEMREAMGIHLLHQHEGGHKYYKKVYLPTPLALDYEMGCRAGRPQK